MRNFEDKLAAKRLQSQKYQRDFLLPWIKLCRMFRPVYSKLFWLATHFWANKILATHQKKFFGQIRQKIIQKFSLITFFGASFEKLVIFGLFGKISRHS
jgi:hypothetical protein